MAEKKMTKGEAINKANNDANAWIINHSKGNPKTKSTNKAKKK